MNDFKNIEFTIKEVKRIGKHAQGTIAYTTSPVHNMSSWLDLGKKIEDCGADSLAIKDMAGLLRPFDAYDLVKNLKNKLNIDLFSLKPIRLLRILHDYAKKRLNQGLNLCMSTLFLRDLCHDHARFHSQR